MNPHQTLTPLQRRKSEIPRTLAAAAIALDGDQWGGCEYLVSGDNESLPIPDPSGLLDHFLSKRFRGWTLLLHNADHVMYHLLPHFVQRLDDGYSIRFLVDGAARIIFARITRDKHKWVMRDTFALMPKPLPDLAPLANYSGINFDLRTQAKILMAAYKAFHTTMAETFGVPPAITIGSTAVHAFQTTIPEGQLFYRQRREVEDMGREALFGGLLFINSQATQYNVTKVDVNAMYAVSMRGGVPVMSGAYTEGEIEGLPGIYECSVLAEGVDFPMVPYRDPVTYRIRYPHDEAFTTVLTANTIAQARQLGYKIDPFRGYVFPSLGNPFDDFVNKCEELEGRWREKGARLVIKMLRNSLYGKFGQKSVATQYILTREPTPMMAPAVNFADGRDIPDLYQEEVEIQRHYMMPVWAAWITAEARNILTRSVMALGPRSCVYGDTDSIVTSAPLTLPLGRAYGEWKIEAEYDRFRALGRKRYVGLTRQGEVVNTDYRIAGIPRWAVNPDVLMDMLPGQMMETKPYRTEQRAINHLKAPVDYEPAVKYIHVPELQPFWADL